MGIKFPEFAPADGDDETISPITNARSVLGADPITGATRRVTVDSDHCLLVNIKKGDAFSFTPDKSLRVQFANSSRLIWDTEIDWNKGLLDSNLEIFGVGSSAVLRPKQNIGIRSISWDSAAEYTLSDVNKLEIISGSAKLKALSGNEVNYAFSNGADYTYDSNKIIVNGGIAKLVGMVGVYTQYHLNESSGTTATDSSGNGRNGTTVNNPSWVAAKLNNGLQLNGTNQTVNCGAIAGFERTNVFSLEAWIKTTKTTAQCIVSKMLWSAPYTGWRFFLSAGKPYFNLYGTSDVLQIHTNDVLSDGNWHHCIATYDGTSLASGVKIYLDGSLKTNIVDNNSITSTILNSASCYVGSRENGGERWLGILDEVVIYDKVLSQVEVTSRYNSGAGTEGGGYDTGNPTIVNNTGFTFVSSLVQFIETSSKPSGSDIKYHISSDNGSTWKYWSGSSWTITDNTYTQANTASEINTNIGSLGSSGILKFRALLHSDTSIVTPELDNIYTKELITYSTQDNLYIDTKDAAQIIDLALLNWQTATFSSTIPVNTDIKVLFSVDGRISWLTWNGVTWITPVDSTLRVNATDLTTVITNFSTLPIGIKTLDIRVFLNTNDLSITPLIDNLDTVINEGYSISGYYETNIFDSNLVSQLWEIFDASKISPSGTSVVIKCRSSNSLSDMGSYGSPLTIGNSIGLNGQFIQFSIEFVGTLTARALVDYISVRYVTPLVYDINP